MFLIKNIKKVIHGMQLKIYVNPFSDDHRNRNSIQKNNRGSNIEFYYLDSLMGYISYKLKVSE